MGRKALVLWLAVVLAVAGAAAGGSLALFRAESARSTANFTAGTLTLESVRDRGESGPGPLFYSGAGDGIFPTGMWQPGDYHWHILHVINTGSTNAVLQGLRTTLRGGDPALAQWLQVRITAPDPADPATQVEVANTTVSGLLAGMVPLAYPGGAPLTAFAGDLTELRFFVSLPLQAPNALQGKSIQVDLTIFGEQLH